MMKNFIYVIFVFTLISFNLNATEIAGICFEDLNKNMLFDTNEKGIPNVLISNGRDIIQANNDGTYKITAEEGDVIFAINPSGYTFLKNNLGNFHFYYNHFPNGSPVKEFSGTKPTARENITFNIPLIRQVQNNDFKVVLFGDSQVRNIDEIKWLQQSSVAAAMSENAQFGVSLGDIIYDELSLFPNLVQGITASKIDWHFLPGNHDINFDATTQKDVDDTYNKFLGPSYYSFNYAKVHFISLFNVMYQTDKKYHAELGNDQLEFIKNDLKFVDKNKFIVLLMHIPMNEMKDRDKLFKLFEGRDNTLSFAGHTHTNQQIFFGKKEGWNNQTEHHHVIAGATCGSWWNGAFDNFGIPMSFMRCGSPKGYWTLEFKDNNYKLNFKPESKNSSNFSIWTYEEFKGNEELSRFHEKRKDSIFINFFVGGPKSNVRVRFNNGIWQIPDLKTTIDPYYDQVIFLQESRKCEDERFLSYWISKYNTSNHLWSMEIPKDLPKGSHIIEVEMSDPYVGQEKGYRIINIE